MNVTPESARNIADVAMTVTAVTGAGSSWLGYLNNNAAGIGVVMTFFFGVCGVTFYVLSYRKASLADVNAVKVAALESKIDQLLEIGLIELGEKHSSDK